MINPGYVIVQAGGKGTRLKDFTRNKPKAIVSVNNLPIIFHLFRKFPDKKFVIIGDYKKDVMEKYLDDAYLAHMTQVTVIHGRGTGALRTAVHNRLKKLKYVKSYRLGEFGEGDMGVTIVTFKS